MKVCWLSAGVSSFIAGYLAKDVDKFIYIDIADQHPDSLRFIHDCEKVLNQPVEILKNKTYNCVEDVCRACAYINGVAGAKCTQILKKRVRKEWEQKQTEPLIYVWGMDYNERNRAERLIETMDWCGHEFPLIDRQLTKAEAHGMCQSLGVKRPAMYDLGYSNNNCIGCVKGGKGYWNKIRIDFPEVFKARAKMERDIGASCINGTYLDELDPGAGRQAEEIMDDCDLFCMMQIQEDKA